MTQDQNTIARTTREKRLIYRSWHRGTKELDLLLGPFADAEMAALSDQDLDAYEVLLEVPEPLLYDLLVGKASAAELETPVLITPVLGRIHAFLARPRF